MTLNFPQSPLNYLSKKPIQTSLAEPLFQHFLISMVYPHTYDLFMVCTMNQGIILQIMQTSTETLF